MDVGVVRGGLGVLIWDSVEFFFASAHVLREGSTTVGPVAFAFDKGWWTLSVALFSSPNPAPTNGFCMNTPLPYAKPFAIGCSADLLTTLSCLNSFRGEEGGFGRLLM